MAASGKRAVLYARISVSKEESVSIDRQLESGRRYAEGRGWQVVGEFIDDGVSATENRPWDRAGFTRLLEWEGFDAVVIWKVDRLARRVLDFLTVDQMLQARGAGLVAVEDPIDMTTPMGRAFATILAVFGEMEAAAISARIRAAREYMLAEGRHPGGALPFGYASAPIGDRPGFMVVRDEERWPWLLRIVERARAGETVNSIAVWLTRSGAPLSVVGESRRKTADRSWNRQSVITLLRSPRIAGMTPRNPGSGRGGRTRSDAVVEVLRDEDGDPIVDEHLAAISPADWRALVASLDARTCPQSVKKADRQHTSPLMSQVARCDDCGVFLNRSTNQKRPVLTCPKCRQTLSRATFDPYMVGRLLDERGEEMLGAITVREAWARCGSDDTARRRVLVSQIESLRIRRGVVGRYFDEERVLLVWRPALTLAGAA